MKYYVTTGISLSTQSRCWKGRDTSNDGRAWDEILELSNASEVIEDIKRLHEDISAQFDGARDVLQRAEEVVAGDNGFDPECWSENGRKLLPAELATIFMMQRDGRIFSRQGLHEVIFVGSETNRIETALCCAILRQLVGLNRVPGLTTRVLHLNANWDPRNTRGLLEAVEEFNQSELTRNDDAEFVLTGGYKAVIIALVLKIMLKAFDMDERNPWITRLYHLHESSEELVILPMKGGDIDPGVEF